MVGQAGFTGGLMGVASFLRIFPLEWGPPYY